VDVPLKVIPEILEAAFQRFRGPGRQCAKSMSRAQLACMGLQLFEIRGLAAALFQVLQDLFNP
jgi:hypothetical protein